MTRVGKISSIEGEKYRVLFEELGEIVTLPLPRLQNKFKFKLSQGDQNLEVELEKFKVGQKVVVSFLSDGYEDGVILGAIND